MLAPSVCDAGPDGQISPHMTGRIYRVNAVVRVVFGD
jgi:hypothetical protein